MKKVKIFYGSQTDAIETKINYFLKHNNIEILFINQSINKESMVVSIYYTEIK